MERTDRIRLLDILRGVAILGTLGTNIWIFAYLGDLSYITTSQFSSWWELDDFVRMIILFLVNGKLLGLLTIMFGVGMELKYRQMQRKGRPWPGVYMWTAVFLLVEGFLHFTLVMEYDILMSYGVTAIIAAFIIKRGEKVISCTMKALGGIHAAVILLVMIGGLLGANMSLGSFQEVVGLYRDGSWIEQVQYRLANFLPLRAEAIFVIPMNIFLFLLGVRLMRSGVFAEGEEGKRKRGKLLKWGLGIGLPLNALIFIPGGVFDLPVRYLFAPILALGYIGVIGRVVENSKGILIWRCLEKTGQMSLSCYVTQNILASAIFYGWGLGLGGKLDALGVILIWISISLIQVLFAASWMNAFKLGPLEAARQRMLKAFM
ncbi:DUF418 domain-containing protein [Lysinibacillus sp. 3P01SB]|uniref:DUF418 domain-containing protein n=1 Tax=Lysinibacillus sp. 3P01SB TaxID=3132284 RepID=UPI0039A5A50D